MSKNKILFGGGTVRVTFKSGHKDYAKFANHKTYIRNIPYTRYWETAYAGHQARYTTNELLTDENIDLDIAHMGGD